MKKTFLIFMFILGAFTGLNATTVVVDFDNNAVDAAIGANVASEIHQRVDKFSKMNDFARGFGNANTYASHVATQRGYQGYDIFAISAGTMMSVQLPSSDPSAYTDIEDDLESGDIYAGIGMQPVAIQGGLNLGFLVDGLYGALKVGKFSYDADFGDQKIEYDSFIIGAIADYQIINKSSLVLGLLVWRGVTIESGLVYSSSEIVYFKDISKFTVNGSGYSAEIDPSISMGMDVSTLMIPVEIYTSCRLLWIANLGIGAGVDIVIGETDLNIKSTGSIRETTTNSTGRVVIDAGTKGESSDIFKPKLSANIGLSLGPLFIDIPASVYLDNGYSVGITAGIVW